METKIEKAMAEALANLGKASDMFRDHGQNDVANGLGKLGIQMADAFKMGFRRIPYEQWEQVSDEESDGYPVQPVAQTEFQNGSNGAATIEPQKDKNPESRRHDNELQTRYPQYQSHARTSSWAKVAGSSMGHQNGTRSVPPTTSLESFPLLSSKQVIQLSAPSSETSFPSIIAPSPSLDETPLEAKAGILRVRGPYFKELLQNVTSRIHEGPLLEIRWEDKQTIRIVFQHASHALSLLYAHEDLLKNSHPGRFGLGYTVELVGLEDWNDDHRRMNQPIRERRRLSFARKAFFSPNLKPEKWKHDIRSLVGSTNIDFFWVFNSGNAMAVFTSTKVARKVYNTFQNWSGTKGHVYEDASVTFSADPCEREIPLFKPTVNRPYHRSVKRS